MIVTPAFIAPRFVARALTLRAVRTRLALPPRGRFGVR